MTLVALDGGQSPQAVAWDGMPNSGWLRRSATTWLRVRRPSDSIYAPDLEAWAANLTDAGRERLESLGLPGRTLTIATQEVAP